MGAAGEDPPPPPPPDSRRRSNRPRAQPAWLADPQISQGDGTPRQSRRRAHSRDVVGVGAAPDSGEGSVRRRLTAAATFQREEEMLAKVSQVYEGYYYFR